MSNAIQGISRRPHIDTEPAQDASESSETRREPVGDKRSAGTRELVSGYTAGRTRDPRAAAAHKAVSELAAALPGHGVDVSTFASRFASKPGTPAQVAGQARYGFMRAALTNNPGLADRAIAFRLRGSDAHTRNIVRTDVQRSGAQGLARYAVAEQALSALSGFDKYARDEIDSMVKAGEPLKTAVAHERAELAREAKVDAARANAPSMKQQVDAAVARVKRDGEQVKQLNDSVNQLYRKVPVLSRVAEAAVGYANITATPSNMVLATGKSAVTGSLDPINELERDVERNAGYALGHLNKQINQAQAAYSSFAKKYVQYADDNRALRTAIANGQHEKVVELANRVNSGQAALSRLSKEFAPMVEQIARANGTFDADLNHAVIHVLTKAAFKGLTPFVIGGGHGAETVGHTLKHKALEGAEAAVVHTVASATHGHGPEHTQGGH